MFLDIEKSLKEIETRYVGVTLNIQGSSKEFSDVLLMLKDEKTQFEVRQFMVLSLFCILLLYKEV